MIHPSQIKLGATTVAAVFQTTVGALDDGNNTAADGYTLQDGDFVLLTAETPATKNGIYQHNSGNLTRPTAQYLQDGETILLGATLHVLNGVLNASDTFVLTGTNGPVSPHGGIECTIGTHTQVWENRDTLIDVIDGGLL